MKKAQLRVAWLTAQRDVQETEMAHRQALAVAAAGGAIDLAPFVDAKTKAVEAEAAAKLAFDVANVTAVTP
jgi:hypothetical protein